MLITTIINEASHAGEDPRELQRLTELENLRITPDKDIPPMQFLFQMFCKPCFPRGELVAIAGKAKSGKTFVSSILMSLCYRDEVLTVRRMEEEPLSVLWFDTEQSEESTQDILTRRIIPMINTDEHPSLPDTFHVFNLRSRFWQDRLPLLETAIRRFTPDLVVLDGIRDLVNDINDGVLAQDVIERLMHLASETSCCLVCILHQNKGSEDHNLRGWIGTELRNKAFEVYECTKDADRIFTWKQTDTRKHDIVDHLKYVVDEQGIPQLCSVDQMMQGAQSTQSELYSRPPFNEDYVLSREGKSVVLDVERLFTDAFKPGEIVQSSTLQARIMRMANITSYKYYNARREEALAKGIIEKSAKESSRSTHYICPSKPALPEPKPTQSTLNFEEQAPF